ncbi:MAG: hypothetical protein M3Y13_09185 [Armatimonadota bacterium]|nr:hypothetical protein [Armatimonadota bacterium]
MTITVAPKIETRLRRKAARTGQDANTLAEAVLWDALADEASDEELREEYHSLVDLELAGRLSDAQATRLAQITRELDERDAQSPAAQAMRERLDETGRKLDEMLAILQSLPRLEPA